MKKSHEEAVRWFRMAAEQGNVNAHFCLAVAYGDGQGVEQSYEAERWCRMAADQGNAAARFFMGVAFENS